MSLLGSVRPEPGREPHRIADLALAVDDPDPHEHPAGPWPRDEWIIGEGQDGREYVVHSAPPRFIARVVMTDEKDGTPLDSEEPADLVGGIVYAADPGTVLCEIDWIDEPQPSEITALMEAAAEAIEAAG